MPVMDYRTKKGTGILLGTVFVLSGFVKAVGGRGSLSERRDTVLGLAGGIGCGHCGVGFCRAAVCLFLFAAL